MHWKASVFRSTSFVDCFSTMADLDNLSADMDAANLYTEEIVTDRKMGTIHVLTPITPEGAKDPTRAPIFTGEVQIMTQNAGSVIETVRALDPKVVLTVRATAFDAAPTGEGKAELERVVPASPVIKVTFVRSEQVKSPPDGRLLPARRCGS